MNLNKTILVVALISGTSSFADDLDPVLPGPGGKPKIAQMKMAPIDEVFVPGGFDDNDVSEVILKGTLPNSCWKVGGANVSFDDAKQTYQLSVASYILEGQICLPVTSTFVESVKLGVLKSGEYAVKAATQDSSPVAKTLKVKPASTQTSDEHLYAQVESVQLVKQPTGEVQGFEWQGEVPALEGKCLEFSVEEPRVENENVLTVLPILVEGTHCPPAEIGLRRDFSSSRSVPDSLRGKPFLIHIRSLNGQSVNRYVPAN